mgnify:CR=1 FL=1
MTEKNKVIIDGYRLSSKAVGAVSTKYAGRTQFLTMVTFEQIVHMFPKVDPAKPHDRNRRVDAKRARAAGQYWLDHPTDWIFPPLIVTLDEELEFHAIRDVEIAAPSLELQLVKLSIPHDFAYEAFIADGQHRVFGINDAYSRCHQALRDAKDEFKQARDSGASDSELEILKAKVDLASKNITRFETETIGVQIIANANKELQQEWFITMSDFQKPIGRGESVRMDEKTNLTIATKQLVASHPLFAGEFPRSEEDEPNPRVDERKDNVSRASDALYSLANLRDWIATLILGSKTETSVNNLDELVSIDEIVKIGATFFDTFTDSVSYFKKLVDGSLRGSEFRKINGFSSPTIIRGLALAANSELLGAPFESDEFKGLVLDQAGVDRFKKLLTSLTSELEYEDDPTRIKPQKKRMKQANWYATQLFREGATAPQSGFQDRARLGEMFRKWSSDGKIDFADYMKGGVV